MKSWMDGCMSGRNCNSSEMIVFSKQKAKAIDFIYVGGKSKKNLQNNKQKLGILLKKRRAYYLVAAGAIYHGQKWGEYLAPLNIKLSGK